MIRSESMKQSTVAKNVVKGFLAFFIAIFIVTFAIAVPILFRPYYFWNVKLLDIEEESGYTYDEIKVAFNELMDYMTDITGKKEFSTGSMAFSESGKSHFEDCKKLFMLDFIALGVSAIYIAVVTVLVKTGKLNLRYKKRSPAFRGVVGLGAFVGVVGVWAAIDFDGFFETFHHIAFPGKTNWVFNPWEDEIINILPIEVWMSFGILIVAIVAVFVAVILATEKGRRRKYGETEQRQKS